MNTRSQVWCAWAGFVGVVLIVVSMLVAGYLPPPGANASATALAAFYRDNVFSIRLGLLIGLIAMGGWAAVVAVVSVQLSEIEGRRPVMAALQAISGASCYVFLTLFVVLLGAAAFRPERPPTETQLLHDIGWFMAFLAATPFVLEALATGLAILWSDGTHPGYPRWLGHLGIWVAVVLLPGVLLLFFQTGPFAYDGIISFWIPLLAFGGWMAALSWAALRFARAESGARPAAPPVNRA